MKSLLRIAAMICLAAAAGAIQARLMGMPWAPAAATLQEESAKRGLQAKAKQRDLKKLAGITLDQFKEMIADSSVVIDARPAEEFAKGHLAVDYQPPVLNVEPHLVDQQIERLMPLQGLPMVLYCTSPTCELAEELYVALENVGFSGMKIYTPGWEGIQKSGLPTVAGPDTWAGFATDASTEAAEDEPAAEEAP